MDKQSIIIAKEDAEAQIALDEALPALEAAKLALENIKKKELDEIKALAAPPTAILDVCAVCFYLYPKSSGNAEWSLIKAQMLSDFKLIDDLKNYDVGKTKHSDSVQAKKRMAKIEKDCKNDVEDLSQLAAYITAKKSVAAGGLYAWCSATLRCYDINRDVEPKK